MKKIFILTGEPSGDKLASKVIAQLKISRTDIEYLSVGGEHLKNLGIQSLYNLNEVTYLGFTRVLLNIFKIKKKINDTAKEIIKFKGNEFINEEIIFKGKIGRIRDIKIHKETGELYMLSDEGELWRMYK